ncbi:MAG: tetratricopeptide repeat protein, partial [bacterium]
QEKSIVVLPFENISPDPEQEYFSDGLTEEIIADLSHIHNLRVISRTSAMMLKGTKKDMKTIGRELNVKYVLEGSVRKAGNNLRITAQLIDATNDAHIWAEKYSGTLDDVFDIQEKVSRSIADALKLKLTTKENKVLSERPLTDDHAYDCYLRARQEMNTFTEDGLERALTNLHNGLNIIGENALLYGGIGSVYCNYYELGIKADEETLRNAEEYAFKVLKLEPNSAISYNLLGRIERFRGSSSNAIKNFKRALEIDPNDYETLLWLGITYFGQAGKVTAAESLIKRLFEIDPLAPSTHLALGFVHWMKGELDRALTSFNQMLELEPENIHPNFWSAYVLAWKKQYNDVYNLIDQMAKKESPDQMHKIFTGWLLFFKHALKGEREKALEMLTDDAKNYFWNDPDLPWIGACNYALIDEKEEALNWLEHAINKGWINYPLFNEIDPLLENIRGEERFKKLMEQIKHEWEHFEV